MLTLTRKLGEGIQIGDNVTIVVKEIRRNTVRLTIYAPKEVKLYRTEVYRRISEEKTYATSGTVELYEEDDDE